MADPSTPCNSVPVLFGLLRLSRIVSFSSHAKLHQKFFSCFCVCVFFSLFFCLIISARRLRETFSLFFLGFSQHMKYKCSQPGTKPQGTKPQGAHTICLCSRLLFYSKCTRFTVCFTYSDISLNMYINQ